MDTDTGQSEEHRHFVRTEIALLKSAQQAQAADMSELKLQLATGMQQIQTNLQSLSTEFVNSHKANWGEYRGWIFGGATVLGMILTMGGVVLALFVQASIGPLTTVAELSMRDRGEIHQQLRDFAALASSRGERLSNLEQAAATATAQRAELLARVERQGATSAANGERITAVEQQLIEVETQFRALDNTANLMRATELRMIGLLWEKVYRQKLPEFFFAPNIARNPG